MNVWLPVSTWRPGYKRLSVLVRWARFPNTKCPVEKIHEYYTVKNVFYWTAIDLEPMIVYILVREVLFLNPLEIDEMRKNTLAFLVNNYTKLGEDVRQDVFDMGVQLGWVLDVIHFNYHPLGDEKARPEVMMSIGRGLELYSAFERVDRSSIVLGFNGTEIDYPDLCDVYIESAKCQYTGLELSEEALDELSDDHALKMEALT